jgi:small subunit ribosomal protein S5
MEEAKRSMSRIPLTGGTLPHLVWGRWGATRVLLKPASPGTGVIAGGGVRAVMESAGVQDVLTKIIGSRNPFNVVRATFDALNHLMTPVQVQTLRGLEAAADEELEASASEQVPADETLETETGVAEAAPEGEEVEAS